MAHGNMKTVAATALCTIDAATLFSEIVAQSPCHSEIASVSPCYSYIGGSSPTPPPQCCNQFENVVNTQPECLCQILNENGLNKTRILAIPGACNIQTPPVNFCYSPPPSGHSIKTSNSLLLSLLTIASYAGILIII